MENLAAMIGRYIWFICKVCVFGVTSKYGRSFESWCLLLIVALSLGCTVAGSKNYLQIFFDFVFQGDMPLYFQLFFYMSPMGQCYTLWGLTFVGFLFFWGLADFRRKSFFQRAIRRTGLKTALGETPRIKAIIPTGEYRSKVIVETYGVGLDKFEKQKASLTAGFRQKVESIVSHEDKGQIVIHLCERDLPKMVRFDKLYDSVKEPYSFIVGQSLHGPIVQSIRSLPHLLVSGATGGGKSVFFRSTVLSLLKGSPRIQVYLLDLKRGVEVKEFSSLPNVKTAKDEQEATSILEALVDEMNRRYRVLEDKGYKIIDPERDKLDLIVVGIDEAAVLFGKKSNTLARKYIVELARLARAAGIHLMLSTQKPVKEAIDTEALDNLPGRMTFRMVSSAASNVAMGRNLAKKLPPVKGRGMWTNGSEHKEIQAPYIDDELIQEEVRELKEKFTNGTRQNFHPLLLETPDGPSVDELRISYVGEEHEEV